MAEGEEVDRLEDKRRLPNEWNDLRLGGEKLPSGLRPRGPPLGGWRESARAVLPAGGLEQSSIELKEPRDGEGLSPGL